MQAVSNIKSEEAFNALKDNAKALLIDVRTDAEFTYVGVPDLSGCKGELFCCSIYEFPHMELNPNFEDIVGHAINDFSSEELYFICRSGTRSGIAAQLFSEKKGYKCYNVSDGFEGKLDQHSHRNTIDGWKVSQLPWRQK